MPKIRTVADARKAVSARLKSMDWTAYTLAEKLKGKVSARPIYYFLSTESDRKQKDKISLTALTAILDTLGLEMTIEERKR